ncbi:MAG: two-component system response regulator AtoC [Gammaproteobacteria bacterium]|jgi:two-component system response regulator AtoC
MTFKSNSSFEASVVPILKKRILLVEDEEVFARAVQKKLTRAGYVCDVSGSLAAARVAYEESLPDLILLDMRLPDGSGLELLESIREKNKTPMAVLVLSAYGEIEDAVSAMKLGASDYLKKPIDLDELLVNVKKVLDREELTRKLAYSSKREQHATEGVDFLGTCQPIEEVRKQIHLISELSHASNTVPPTVLILGETGSGKDVAARLLHANSNRHDKPFVHVDCASLPKDLIEAELFGHERGAFTNAHISRTGLIEAAEDGVLFLDEIGELPLDLQSKLLAVLERRTIRKVGTSQELPIAAWIMAATNREIAELVSAGEFRSDLYYRLNVLTIGLPALADRGDDIILLANHFAGQTAKRYGLNTPIFTKSSEREMTVYSWPGNVRELKHMVERAVLLSGGSRISPDRLQLPGMGVSLDSEDTLLDENATLGSAELTLIKQAMQRTNGNVSKAARALGVTRMALRYRLKKYNL